MEIRPVQEADAAGIIDLWADVFAYTAPHNDPATAFRQKLMLQRPCSSSPCSTVPSSGTVMGGDLMGTGAGSIRSR